MTSQAEPVVVADAPMVDVTTAQAESLLALARASDLAELGQTDYTPTDIQRVLAAPGTKAWAIVEDGEYRAAGWLENRPHRPVLDGELLLHPQARPGAAERMLDQLLSAARSDEQHRPVHFFAHVDYRPKRSLYDARGGEVVRHFFRMEIDLPVGDAQPVVWPDGVTVAAVDGSDGDFRALHAVIDTAFRDHWNHAPSEYETWLARHTAAPGYDQSLWWLIRRDGVPVAAAIMESADQLGYVDVLGTLREARGLGLAARLLRTAFAEFTQRGCTTSALHVDAANPTGAVRLYESVGMHAALHYACYEIHP